MTSSSDPRTPERQAAIDAFNTAVEALGADASTTAIASLLVQLPCACLVKDGDARITYGSPEYDNLFACGEPVGRLEHELLPPDLQAICNSTDDVVLRRGRTISLTCNVSAEGVADRFFHAEKIPLTDRGRIVGLASVTAEVAGGVPRGRACLTNSHELLALRQKYEGLESRERELASMLSHGAVNKNLATHFDVSVRSIENWRRTLLTKLELDNIPELTRWVVRAEDTGLLPR